MTSKFEAMMAEANRHDDARAASMRETSKVSPDGRSQFDAQRWLLEISGGDGAVSESQSGTAFQLLVRAISGIVLFYMGLMVLLSYELILQQWVGSFTMWR